MHQIVYSLKIAAKLCEMGFKVDKIVPNPKKPWLNSYLFENSEELQEALRIERGAYDD